MMSQELKRKVESLGVKAEEVGVSLEIKDGEIFIATKDEIFPLPKIIDKALFPGLQLGHRKKSLWEKTKQKFYLKDFANKYLQSYDCHAVVLALLGFVTKKEIDKLKSVLPYKFSKNEFEEMNSVDLEFKIKEKSKKDGFCIVQIVKDYGLEHSFIALVSPLGKVYRIEKIGFVQPIIVVPLDYDFSTYTEFYGNKFSLTSKDELFANLSLREKINKELARIDL